MNPTRERVQPPAAKVVRRMLIAGGVVGWLVYTAVLTAMTLRLPRPVELIAGAAVAGVLVLIAALIWRRIERSA